MKILVTGSAGKFGQWVVKELQAHNHTVVGADLHSSANALCPMLIANLRDAGEIYSLLRGEQPDGIINLAAVPRPGILPERTTFLTNFEIAYNIFEAAACLEISKVIHASTDSSYGFVFSKHPFTPQYLPVDEAHPQLPQDCYGGSKMLNEYTARIFANANPKMQITCLRICGLVDLESLAGFSGLDDKEAESASRALFSYVDMRDAAVAFRLAAEKNIPGFDVFNIIANDTLAISETKDLISKYYPNAEIRKNFTRNECLFSTEKAAQVLGWQPQYSWRK